MSDKNCAEYHVSQPRRVDHISVGQDAQKLVVSGNGLAESWADLEVAAEVVATILAALTGIAISAIQRIPYQILQSGADDITAGIIVRVPKKLMPPALISDDLDADLEVALRAINTNAPLSTLVPHGARSVEREAAIGQAIETCGTDLGGRRIRSQVLVDGSSSGLRASLAGRLVRRQIGDVPPASEQSYVGRVITLGRMPPMVEIITASGERVKYGAELGGVTFGRAVDGFITQADCDIVARSRTDGVVGLVLSDFNIREEAKQISLLD